MERLHSSGLLKPASTAFEKQSKIKGSIDDKMVHIGEGLIDSNQNYEDKMEAELKANEDKWVAEIKEQVAKIVAGEEKADAKEQETFKEKRVPRIRKELSEL